MMMPATFTTTYAAKLNDNGIAKKCRGKLEGALYMKGPVRSDAYTDLCAFILKHVLKNNECIFIKNKYEESMRQQYNDVSN